MKKFFFLFRSVMQRIFLSKGFWGAAAGIAGMNLLGVYQEVSVIGNGQTSVLYLYEFSNYVNFWVLYLLFAAIPGASLFCIDWENRFFRASIIRCSKRIYGAATACACFISSMLVVLLGEWLFLFVLRIPYPFYLEQDAIAFGLDTSVFSIFMGEFEILGYFLFGTFVKAFCAGFFAMFSLWLSTKIPNIFVALTSPVILYFLWENLAVILKFPSQLQISTVAKGHLFIAGSFWETLLYPLSLFGLLGLVFGIFFTNSEREVVENG